MAHIKVDVSVKEVNDVLEGWFSADNAGPVGKLGLKAFEFILSFRQIIFGVDEVLAKIHVERSFGHAILLDVLERWDPINRLEVVAGLNSFKRKRNVLMVYIHQQILVLAVGNSLIIAHQLHLSLNYLLPHLFKTS